MKNLFLPTFISIFTILILTFGFNSQRVLSFCNDDCNDSTVSHSSFSKNNLTYVNSNINGTETCLVYPKGSSNALRYCNFSDKQIFNNGMSDLSDSIFRMKRIMSLFENI